MATEGLRRRKSKNKTKAKWASSSEVPATGPAGMHDLPDHVLELVLLRLGSSVDLIRAAFTCRQWRRILVEPRFLSLFRSLHAPHAAGHYHDADPCNAGGHVFLPAPSSRDARLDPRRFSLDFLPDPAPAEYGGSSYWALADSRGGLLLFHRCETRPDFDSRCYLDDLVVCEPLTRRCQGIIPPTVGKFFGLFLHDGEATGDGRSSIGISNFRVVASLYDYADDYSRDVPSALVFHSGSDDDGGWREPEKSADIELLGYLEISFAGRANGSFYWAMEQEEEAGAVLALDEATMKYSLATFPGTGHETTAPFHASTFRVVVQDEGAALRVVRLIGNELTVFARLQGGGDWVLERRVDISEATLGLPGREEWHFQEQTAMIVAANAWFVLVTPNKEEEPCWIVSVQLDTMEVERADEKIRCAGDAYPYELPWPPVLQACAAHRRSGRRHR